MRWGFGGGGGVGARLGGSRGRWVVGLWKMDKSMDC